MDWGGSVAEGGGGWKEEKEETSDEWAVRPAGGKVGLDAGGGRE